MSADTPYSIFFFFNDTATTEIYTLSLHDALPIYTAPSATSAGIRIRKPMRRPLALIPLPVRTQPEGGTRSEEHTSELQSPCNLVCRLLLEKKKKTEHAPAQFIRRAYPHIITTYLD